MVINRKVRRTMLESKSQYFGSLALIVLSCFVFTMYNFLSINLTGITSSFEKDYKQEDASFMADTRLNSIAELESKFNMLIQETRSYDYPVSEDKTLRIFSRNTKVDIPALIEGKAPGSSEIIIDPSYAKANKLKIGDAIKLNTRDFKISGTMSLPNYIYPLRSESDIMNDSGSFGIAVINKSDFDNLNKGNSSYAIRFNDDRSSISGRISEFKEYLRNSNVAVLSWMNITDNTRVTYVTAKLDGIDKMSSSVPIVLLLLTCILTGIVMWRMLKRESVIIGTLYALGYKKRNIMKHYLMYPLIISLFGGIIGSMLGALIVKPMMGFYLSFFNMPVGSLSFNIKYILIGILLPVIFLVTSSIFVVNKSLKSSPVDLMKGIKGDNKVGFIERYVKLDKLKFNTKFKIREQLRSVPRSAFLLLGIIMATMMLLIGFAAKSSFTYLAKDSFDETFKYNYHYVFNSIQHGKPDKGEAFSEIPFTLKSDDKLSFTVYGVSPDSQYISFKDKSGNMLKPDKIIITKSLADKLGIKPHDTIKAVSRLDSREYSITVDGIAETYVGQNIYIPLERLNDMIGYPTESYMGLWSTEKLNIPENKLLAAVTADEMRKAFNAMTQPLQAVIGAMTFMSFIMGLIVIYVVTSLTIEENKDNISLMKVLGYRKKEVYSLILNSSSFIVIIGYILGVPTLLASMGALFKSMTKDMSVSIPVTINYIYVFIGFIVIYLTFELSKLLSRRKVNRISMAEALKSAME